MRAMLLKKQAPVNTQPLRDVEIPDPVPGQAGEILVKVSACGACHTDLHIVEGDLPLPRLPLVPGHQIVGTVLEGLGERGRFRKGDRVGIAWLRASCGSCSMCLSGRENLCREGTFTGYHEHGGYAEYVLVPEDYAFPLPAGFDDCQAAPLLCAGIIGYRALKLTGAGKGSRLGIYGFGASAHVTIQVARHIGCEVFVFSRGEGHRKLAEALGAVWTGVVPDRPAPEMDASIMFAPAGDLVPPALEILGRGGTLVLGGIHMSTIPALDYEKHLYYEKTVRSVTASTREDGEQLLDLAARIPVTTHVTRYPMREANKVLSHLKNGQVNGAAVLVP